MRCSEGKLSSPQPSPGKRKVPRHILSVRVKPSPHQTTEARQVGKASAWRVAAAMCGQRTDGSGAEGRKYASPPVPLPSTPPPPLPQPPPSTYGCISIARKVEWAMPTASTPSLPPGGRKPGGGSKAWAVALISNRLDIKSLPK